MLMPMSLLDYPQIIKSVYDASNQALQVSVVATTGSSTAINDGTNPAQKATVNSFGELYVAIGDPTTGTLATVTPQNAVKVDGSAVTQPVSINGGVPIKDGTTAQLATVEASGALKVDSSAFTQPVSQATTPWVENLAQIAGAVPSVTNTLPIRISNGTSFVDPTQIRPLTSATDSVTANAGTNLNTSALALESGGHLQSIDTKFPAQGQALAAASTPVVLPATQITALTPPTTVTVIQPTGTNLHTVIDSGTLTANIGTTNGLALDATVSGTQGTVTPGVAAVKSTLVGGVYTSAGVTLTNAQQAAFQLDSTGKLLVDTGTVTISNLPTGITSSTEGAKVGLNVSNLGYAASNHTRLDYSITNVTTAAYTQLIASTSSDTSEIEIFDSSGYTNLLAVGASGTEVDQIYILPGGNGRIKLRIPASSRVSVKSVVQTLTIGELTINFYS